MSIPTEVHIGPNPNGDGYTFAVGGQEWNHLIAKDGVEIRFVNGMAWIDITLIPSAVSVELPDPVLMARYAPDDTPPDASETAP